MSKDSKYTSIHYNSYLALEELLNCQSLRSEALGKPAHDEMLFIITHQVYELWFKQIIHELKSIVREFEDDDVDENNLGNCVGRLDRIVNIFRLLIEQIRVLETMTPLDFLDFRSYLFPASGFQSFQFRELEVLLGLKEDNRHVYHGESYKVVFDEEKKQILDKLEATRSLHELVEDWLERTPFLQVDDFSFVQHYEKAVKSMLAKEQEAIKNTDVLSEKYKSMRLTMLGDTESYFKTIMDPEHHEKLLKEGKVKMSYKATLAILFINLYRDEPILQMPFRFLSRLVDIDEFLTTWRFRHAQMVLRMLGNKVGTGGSSGHKYLATTAEKHHIFGDLHNVSTLLIPRSDLPALPDNVKERLGFHYSMR